MKNRYKWVCAYVDSHLFIVDIHPVSRVMICTIAQIA